MAFAKIFKVAAGRIRPGASQCIKQHLLGFRRISRPSDIRQQGLQLPAVQPLYRIDLHPSGCST